MVPDGSWADRWVGVDHVWVVHVGVLNVYVVVLDVGRL